MEHFLLAEIKADIAGALQKLDIDDRMIAKAYFGLDFPKMTVRDICDLLCRSWTEVIYIIEVKVKPVMREYLKGYIGMSTDCEVGYANV